MGILKFSSALAFIVLMISSCGGRCVKDGKRDGNAAQDNELPSVSQAIDRLKVRAVTETEVDNIDFYEVVVLDSTPLTTYKRLRPENEADWIGHLMSVDLSEFSSDINDSLNVFIKFDTEVNGYTVTCRFMPFGNDTETGFAVLNFRNDNSDVFLLSDKTCFYHTLIMSGTGTIWKNMDAYEFNYIEPTGTKSYPVNERHPFGYYTPFQFVDVDFDGEKEMMLNDLAMYREGNGYYPYKIKGNRFVPFDIFPYNSIVNSTEFDFKNKTIRSFTHYHADFAEFVYFSLPREKEWRITDFPELHSSSYGYSTKEDILNSQILAIDSIKEYYFDTLFVYRRYRHSLKLTDKTPSDSPRYDTSFWAF